MQGTNRFIWNLHAHLGTDRRCIVDREMGFEREIISEQHTHFTTRSGKNDALHDACVMAIAMQPQSLGQQHGGVRDAEALGLRSIQNVAMTKEASDERIGRPCIHILWCADL